MTARPAASDPADGPAVAGGGPTSADRHVPWLAGTDPTVEPTPVLRVRDLGIAFGSATGRTAGPAVRELSFDVFPGEILAVVGESGSGKSVTARAVLGLLPDTATVTGSIQLRGTEVVDADDATVQPLRGRGAAMVFQEPQSALNPVRTVGWQIAEALRAHAVRDRGVDQDHRTRAGRRRRAVELLDLVGIPEPAVRVDAYPHQLSGGQKQRVVIALALANDPALLIADEPTTALDVTVQAQILRLLDSLRQRLGTAVLLITHNMGVVADLADRMLVMQRGRLVEKGEVLSVFAAPTQPYTQALLAAVPTLPPPGSDPAEVPSIPERARREPGTAGPSAPFGPPGDAALELDGVSVSYPGRLGRPPFLALHDVSVTVARGEVLGVVGESGSGKTTLARVVAGRLPVDRGTLRVDGVDPATLRRSALRAARGRIGLVHQDPATSLDPLLTVGESVLEPLVVHGVAAGRDAARRADARVAALLESVRLPASFRHRRPAELSGGQRQRVALARALALGPALLIADEPTSALDVSVQAAVLDVLSDLQAEHGFACLFISHDLAVVHQVSDRVLVLRSGRVVEQGPADDVLRWPREEYTRRLVAAVPVPDPVAQRARRAG